MVNTLIVNHNIQKCGVANFGECLYRCLKNTGLNYSISIGGYDNHRNLLERLKDFDLFLINWHQATLPWFNNEIIKYIRAFGKKVALIPHDEIVIFDKNLLDAILYIDPSIEQSKLSDKEYVLGRPLQYMKVVPVKSNTIPKIGFAGFCFEHKRIEGILDIIGDTTCELRLHLPPSHWGYNPNYIEYLEGFFRSKLKNNQFLTMSKAYLSMNELIYWMAENDLMIFNYEDNKVINHGVSSITDTALSAKVPFLLSNSNQFRHIYKEMGSYPSIKTTSVKKAIANGFEPYMKLYNKWTPENNQAHFSRIVSKIMV